MYMSMPPMSADDKGPDVDEDDEELEGASVQDQDLVETSKGEQDLEDLDTEETESTQPRKRPRAISDSDESDDPAVDVQGSTAAPLPVAPLRAAPPPPKRSKPNFDFELDLDS